MKYILGLLIALSLFSCKSTQAPITKAPPAPAVTPAAIPATPNSSDVEGAALMQPLELEGFQSPESILRYGDFIYVSNVGLELNPMEKDGDGYITQLGLDGTVILKEFATGLDAPKGMAIIDGILYVADIDRVVGIDINSKQAVSEFDFSKYGTMYLNDLAAKNYSTLVVSATDINKLFNLDIEKGPANAISEVNVTLPLNGPNGLWFDGRRGRLFIAGYGTHNTPNGKLYMMEGVDEISTFSTLNLSYSGYLDGITLVGENHLLFSDWIDVGGMGDIKVFDLNTQITRTLDLPMAEFNGPADFYFDEISRAIWIPAMGEGKVYAFPLELE